MCQEFKRDDSEKFLIKEFGMISHLIGRELDQRTKNLGFSGAEGKILHFVLTQRDEAIFQKDIEQGMSIKPSSVSEILSRMEQKGFIRRVSVSHDARLKKIETTEKVEKLKKEMIADMDKFENEMCQDISEDDIEAFYRVCDQLKLNIKKYGVSGADNKKLSFD